MKKKILALCLFVTLLFSACALPEFSQPEDKGSAFSGEIVVGYLEGDTDRLERDVLSLTTGLATTVKGTDGLYSVNAAACSSFTTAEGQNGERTYIFTLLSDLCYSNGEPVKAEDYMLSVVCAAEYDRYCRQEGISNTLTPDYSMIMGYDEYVSGESDCFYGVWTSGNRLYLRIRSEDLPDFYELFYTSVSPLKLGEMQAPVENTADGARLTMEFDLSWITSVTQRSVTCGGFYVESCTDSEVVLKANPNRKENLYGAEYLILKRELVTAEALLSGEVDLIPSIEENDALSAATAEGKLHSVTVSSGTGVTVTFSEDGPFSSLALRKAFCRLLNYDEYGFGEARGYVDPEGYPVTRDDVLGLSYYVYDYDQIAALFGEEGYRFVPGIGTVTGEFPDYEYFTATISGDYELANETIYLLANGPMGIVLEYVENQEEADIVIEKESLSPQFFFNEEKEVFSDEELHLALRLMNERGYYDTDRYLEHFIEFQRLFYEKAPGKLIGVITETDYYSPRLKGFTGDMGDWTSRIAGATLVEHP